MDAEGWRVANPPRRFGRPTILPQPAPQMRRLAGEGEEENTNRADPEMIAIPQDPACNLLIVEPRTVAAVKVGYNPPHAVKIDPAVLPREEQIADGDIAQIRSSNDQRALQPVPGNLVTVNAEAQTGHAVNRAPFRGCTQRRRHRRRTAGNPPAELYRQYPATGRTIRKTLFGLSNVGGVNLEFYQFANC